MASRHPYYPSTWNVAQGNSLQNGGSGNYLPVTHPQNSYPSPASSIYPTTSTLCGPPALVKLEQHQYGHVVPGHVVEFGTLNGEPINLLDALNDELGDLEAKNEPAFPSYMEVRAKASIRIQIPGTASYTRQFMSLRSNRDATSISRGKLMQTIAKEVKKMMMKGDVLRVPGVGDFPMDEIYCTKIMASSWGANPKEPPAPLVATSTRRRRKSKTITVDEQRIARSIRASYWLCATTVSPFGSCDRRCGVGGRSRSGRRVGRPSTKGLELLLWFRSLFAVLYYALGHLVPGCSATLAYTQDRVTTPFCIFSGPQAFHLSFISFTLAIYSRRENVWPAEPLIGDIKLAWGRHSGF